MNAPFGHPDRPATAWTKQDLVGTLRVVGPWWDLLAAGVPPAVLDGAGAALSATLGRAGAGSGSMAERSLAAATAQPPVDELERIVDGCLALLSAAGRAVAAAGVGAPSVTGTIASVQVSGGGVPKPSVSGAAIEWRGIAGDRQTTRRHHGRVWQALCLWSAECIEGLVAEGHPIAPGRAGENLTLRGVDLGPLRPGTVLRIGTAVCEVSVPALPCSKIAHCFADGDVNRIHHERHPGWSRLYATVIAPGDVEPGDAVEVEPAG